VGWLASRSASRLIVRDQILPHQRTLFSFLKDLFSHWVLVIGWGFYWGCLVASRAIARPKDKAAAQRSYAIISLQSFGCSKSSSLLQKLRFGSRDPIAVKCRHLSEPLPRRALHNPPLPQGGGDWGPTARRGEGQCKGYSCGYQPKSRRDLIAGDCLFKTDRMRSSLTPPADTLSCPKIDLFSH